MIGIQATFWCYTYQRWCESAIMLNCKMCATECLSWSLVPQKVCQSIFSGKTTQRALIPNLHSLCFTSLSVSLAFNLTEQLIILCRSSLDGEQCWRILEIASWYMARLIKIQETAMYTTFILLSMLHFSLIGPSSGVSI